VQEIQDVTASEKRLGRLKKNKKKHRAKKMPKKNAGDPGPHGL